MAPDSDEPWHDGGDWYLEFEWSTLDRTHRRQGGGVRPRYADGAVMNALLRHIEDGLPQQDAARLAGLHPSTFFEWKSSIPAIAEAVKAAEAKLKQRMVAHVSRAAPTNWQAAMTLLERRFPEDFGRRDRVRHEHAGQVGLQLNPALMDERSILLAAELEARLALEDERAADAQRLLPDHGPSH